jgi:UDP-N-acetylmuramoyl-tripeptide--D-alanyl-D-alanine ligase
MPLFTLEEVLEITGAKLAPISLRILHRRGFKRISTDSRQVRPGDLFIALKGDRFDGHEFVATACRAGAVGAIVQEGTPVPGLNRLIGASDTKTKKENPGPLVLNVSDTLRAYQQLAGHHRGRFAIPVVAVTGSNGKTTTKEMVACVLAAQWPTMKTEGNLNSQIGVAQTLLRLSKRYQAAVIEMGVDNIGQTARLSDMVRPTVGIITNIGPDHLEFFGSLDVSAQSKAELLEWLPEFGTVVLNADDAYFDHLAAQAHCRVLSFGFSERADIRAIGLSADGPSGTMVTVRVPGRVRPLTLRLRVSGRHNVANALSAVAVGISLGLTGTTMTRGLAAFRPAAMRSQVAVWKGVRVLNDCYNANPASMKAAIDLLAERKPAGRAVAVLGDMLELGPTAPAFHQEIGRYVVERGLPILIAVGPLGAHIAEGAKAAGMAPGQIHQVPDAEAAAQLVGDLVGPGDAVLVKASRGVHLERVVERLKGGKV